MALILNIEEVKKHLPVTVASSIENLDTYIALAEQKFIIPEIGIETYNYIATKYKNNSITDAKDQQLLELLQKAVTFYAYLLYIPVGQLQISDNGIRIAVTESLKTAFDWQIDNLEDSFKDAGDNCMEITMQYLNTEIDFFTVYAASSAFKEFKKQFISTADQFNLRCSVPLTHRIFKKISMDILISQSRDIKAALGDAFYADLLTRWKNNSITGINIEIIEKIQYALANIALAGAVKSLNVGVNDLGVNTMTNSIFKQKVKTPATNEALSGLFEKLLNDGNYWLGQLKLLLEANRSDLPLYADAFPVSDTPSSAFIPNKIENGLYFI